MLRIVRWEASPNSKKKYRVILSDGTHRDFGARGYDQYRDSSPLGLYKSQDHLDAERRRRYYARHNKDGPKFSADWLSKKYLW